MVAVQRVAAALLLCSAIPALGHEGGIDARGAVVAVAGGHIAVRGADGKEQHFAVTAETRVVVDGAGAKITDVKPGMRAVVHARKSGDRLEAGAIRATAPESPRPTKAK